jgi:hypothetical protein
MSKESESYRLEMLRRLEQESSSPPPPEVLKAEQIVAAFRVKQAKARDAVLRLRSPLPKGNPCPKCYYLFDMEVQMAPIAHPEPSRFDMWKCQSCFYEELRELMR